jgi:hypothetical protein
MRRCWLTIQQQKQVSLRLWGFGLVWIAEIMSRTYRFHNGCTGLEVVTGDTCDISEYVDFSFYGFGIPLCLRNLLSLVVGLESRIEWGLSCAIGS